MRKQLTEKNEKGISAVIIAGIPFIDYAFSGIGYIFYVLFYSTVTSPLMLFARICTEAL